MKHIKKLNLVAVLLQSACSAFGIRSEENPNYEVMHKEQSFEIRSYASYVVAKTTVDGDFKEAQGKAFRILAGYIFGGNQQKKSISMTAPVVMDTPSKSESIAMTSPVVQSPSGDGWSMTFMMPSKYKLSDLPVPKDQRVKF